MTSPFVISNMYSAVTNFQDLLVSGGNVPGSLFIQPGTPNANLTLTIGVDSPTEGFASGHGATATAAGSIFTATPGSNPPLGITNTLQTGDDLEATGSAAGATTLNYTAVLFVHQSAVRHRRDDEWRQRGRHHQSELWGLRGSSATSPA